MEKQQRNKYFKIVLIILIPFIIIYALAMPRIIQYKKSVQVSLPKIDETNVINYTDNTKEEPVPTNETDDNINVAIIGLDKNGYLTDVMISAVYDPSRNVLDLFTIPRDTKVTFSDDIYRKLSAKGWLNKTLKLNEVNGNMSRLGVDEPLGYTLSMMENILGIKYNHFVVIDPDIFSRLIDAIGGVEIYVPEDMSYNDPYQDLYIQLKQGFQHLNGKEAQDFVRYRKGYANGDLGRVEAQQYFIDILLQNMKASTIAANLGPIIDTFMANVKTDVSLGQAGIYSVQYGFSLPTLTLRTHTVPGEAKIIDQVSYYVIDGHNIPSFVHEQLAVPLADSDANSKTTSITILNGSRSNGLASYYQEKLEEAGYTISEIGNFTGTRTKKTKIYVRNEKLGSDLTQYFNYSEVIIDPAYLAEDQDILVILGLNEYKAK